MKRSAQNEKIIFTGILIASLVGLCGCASDSRADGAMHPFIQSRLNELNKQESRNATGIQKIIDALNAKDREAMKAAFSSSALDEAQDMEDGIDYLFALIPEEIQGYTVGTHGEDESLKHGHRTVVENANYTVSTELGEYVFFLMEYTIDTDVPENIGIYALRACREEYKEQYFTYWEDMQIAGIYVPDKS